MSRIAGSLIIALVAVLIQLAPAGTGVAEVVDRIVAEVNDEIITMSELQNMTKVIEAQSGVKPKGADEKKMQREMLEALIDRKLAKAEAKRRGMTMPDKEVNAALTRFKQRSNIPDDETLAKALAHDGLSLKEFKQQIGDQLTQDQLMSAVVGAKVTVNDADIRRIYDEKFKQGGSQGQLHLMTLRMPFPPGAGQVEKEAIRQKAENIIGAVKRGESFVAAAEKLSLKPSDVGFVAQSDLDPRLADYLSQLKQNEVAPVETPEGYQLIQIVGRRSGEVRSFEEVAPEIRRILMQQAMEKYFSDWVKTLREKSHIRIML
jgi:peptidyl-prolyl cis-trans isomerase SurA